MHGFTLNFIPQELDVKGSSNALNIAYRAKFFPVAVIQLYRPYIVIDNFEFEQFQILVKTAYSILGHDENGYVKTQVYAFFLAMFLIIHLIRTLWLERS